MDLLSFIPDNISEVLTRIIRFTSVRRDLLQQNIEGADTPGYVPQDLPVSEFAETLGAAVTEHLQNRRLLFRDGAHVRFGINGRMEIRPVVDEPAAALLQHDRNEYLALQTRKLHENSLNRRVAQQLLKRTSTASLAQADPLDDAETTDNVSADCLRPGM